MPAEAFAVHGLSAEFLKDKPRFAEVADDFLAFIGDAPLVIHNAGFDHGFLNAELKRIERALIARERLVDTLLLARRKHPAGPNRLDDLVRALRHRQFAPHQARRAARRRDSGRGLCGIDRRPPGAARSCRKGQRRPAQRTAPPRSLRATAGAAGAAPQRCRPRRASRIYRHARRRRLVAELSTGRAKPEGQVCGAGAVPAACTSASFFRYSPTKSTGSSSSGGKPPLRTVAAMISRAKGNKQPRAFDQHDRRSWLPAARAGCGTRRRRPARS